MNEISFVNGQSPEYEEEEDTKRNVLGEKSCYGNVGVQKCGREECINDTIVFSRKQFFGDAKDRIKIRFLIKSQES